MTEEGGQDSWILKLFPHLKNDPVRLEAAKMAHELLHPESGPKKSPTEKKRTRLQIKSMLPKENIDALKEEHEKQDPHDF